MPTPEHPGSVDSIDKLLLCGIVFFTILLVLMSKWAPNDGQTFQVISGLLTGFAAAFFARLKPGTSKKGDEPERTPNVQSTV